MTASITRAGERLIAEKQAAHEGLEVVRFVLALIPGQDPESPVDRDAGLPLAEHQVHAQAVTQSGFVNPNQVVYSLMMDSDTGDFDWNWMGLVTAEEVLLAVTYVPVQQKRQNRPPVQIGNNVTRNFLLMFDGAQHLTDIHIDANTWQHDFTVRLKGIDKRERLTNTDIFGRAAFYNQGFEVASDGTAYWLKPGLAYIAGIRVQAEEIFAITPPSYPCRAWLDVALQREISDVVARWTVVFGDDLQDYTDSANVQHFRVLIADIASASDFQDRRAIFDAQGVLIEHFAARHGDYKQLRARATTKTDVGLGNLPNAVSDDPASNSSEILATTAALNHLNQNISDSLVGMVASFDMETAPPGWLKRNGADVSRITYAKLFAAIGTRYGAGDGSTTFNVGDSRGLFLRGLDDGRGLDPGRTLGSLQQSQNLAHDHVASAAAVGDHAHGAWTDAQGVHGHHAWTDAQGNHTHPIACDGGGNENILSLVHSNNADEGRVVNPAYLDYAGLHSHNVGVDASGAHVHNVGIGGAGNHSHTITVHAAGGAEARPINQALLVCIKY